MNKPNLIILGSQKSGTTSLHKLISYSNDVHVSNPLKEPNFFLSTKRINSELRRHGFEAHTREQLFQFLMSRGYNNERYFCEASTGYTYGDNVYRESVPERMKKYSDSYHFIYIVRDPIERLVSSYRHWLKRNNGEFSDFIKSNVGIQCIRTSMYHYQVSPYIKTFGIQRFLFLKFEDIVNSPKIVSKSISEFLEIDDFPIPDGDIHLNRSSNRVFLSESINMKNRVELMSEFDVVDFEPIKEDAHKFSKVSDITFNFEC